jgi:aminopeptidase N
MVAMEEDQVFNSTHPVQVDVPDPNSLMEIFDTISYAKGSAICRMLHNYLGDSAFKRSL